MIELPNGQSGVCLQGIQEIFHLKVICFFISMLRPGSKYALYILIRHHKWLLNSKAMYLSLEFQKFY